MAKRTHVDPVENSRSSRRAFVGDPEVRTVCCDMCLSFDRAEKCSLRLGRS